MRNRIKPLLAAAAGMIVSIGFLVAGSNQPASAAAPVTLPISSFYQMVVDAAHGHIFISQGSSSQNGILVTDLSGQVVTTITGQSGVTGLALSPDGSTLYAALSTGDAVTAISTDSLTQTASYPLPSGDSPSSVAVQSGKIWVSYNTGTAFAAAIGFFDPSAASPSLQSPAAMGGWSSAPQLAADPRDTGVLVGIGANSTTGLASYDTATDPVTTLAGSPGGKSVCGNEQDLSVAPGGAEFAVACHDQPAEVDQVYSTATLSPLRSLGSGVTDEFQLAVSYDAAGDIAAGTTNFIPNPDLFIYPPGGTTAENTVTLYSLSTQGGILVPRGLAWVPDGSQLFAVLSRGSTFVLATVPTPAAPQPAPTSTTVSCQPTEVTIGQATSCTTVVTDTAPGATAPTGAVTFASDTAGGTFSGNSSCTLAPSQSTGVASCTVTYTPGQGSLSQTVTASYGGNSRYAASSGQASVTVTLIPSTTVLTCQPGTVVIGQTTSCTAVVTDTSSSPTSPAGTVTFASDTGGGFSSNSCAPAPDGTTGQSSCTVSYTPDQVGSGTQTVTASYGGDVSHAASSSQDALTVTLRATTTVLTCQKSLPVLQKCTATVSDTSSGNATAPAGTVGFSSSGHGVFSATQCTLSGNGTSASCTVSFRTPAGQPFKNQTITASYGGDSTHQGSTGSATLR